MIGGAFDSMRHSVNEAGANRIAGELGADHTPGAQRCGLGRGRTDPARTTRTDARSENRGARPSESDQKGNGEPLQAEMR